MKSVNNISIEMANVKNGEKRGVAASESGEA
jgi:hypothetical protein